MFTNKQILKVLVRIPLIALALYSLKAFWVYFALSFGSMSSILITPVMLGYVYIIVGLVRFKRWAQHVFLTIVVLAVFMAILFTSIIKDKEVIRDALEWFFIMVFWISLVVIPVSGISFLVRRLRKKPE